MTSSDTLTAHPRDAAPAAPPSDYLFVVLESARPDAGGARYCLDEIAAVHIGRGRHRGARVEDRVLHVELPDRKLSSSHARIVRSLTGWELYDTGSKNGSFVNGAAVARASLADGDEIELGHTLLSFRVGLHGGAARAIVDQPDNTTTPHLATMLPELAETLARVSAVARAGEPVLITGETGTGKELTARAIHALSGRAGPFVALNCGAIPPGLVEAELFGHRRGAFTGAADERIGYVREADRGTLLLDEIGDLPLTAQAALLRVLNDRKVVPVGDTRPTSVDFRLISATHRDLDSMVDDGEFRHDLFARLGAFRVTLPPLRERREDLGLLIGAIAAREGPVAPLTIEAARVLYRYAWPHNIRELAACLSAATVLAAGAAIEPNHLPPALAAAVHDDADTSPTDRRRRTELIALLREHDGNVSAVARAMGKARMQIQRWLKRYDLDPEQFRS